MSAFVAVAGGPEGCAHWTPARASAGALWLFSTLAAQDSLRRRAAERGAAVVAQSGFSDGASPSGQGEDSGAGGGGFDFSILKGRIESLKEAEAAEQCINWRKGRCTHHTVAVLDVWVRRLRLHGNCIAAGSHTGECYIIDGLCGRSTQHNLYPDTETEGPISTARCIRQYIGLEDEITSIDYDGSRLVAGTVSGALRVWETNENLVKESWEPGSGCQVLAGTPEDAVVLSGHCAPITHCQLLPQQRVITSSVDGNIIMWDGRNGRVMYRIPVGASVTSLHATPRHIIAGLGDGRVAVWSNPESPKKLPRLMLSFTGHPAPITCIQMLHDEQFEQDLLVTGAEDGLLRSWDVKNGGAWLHEFSGHRGKVVSLQVDESKVLSASRDGSIRCWDLRSGKSLFGIWGLTPYIGSVQFDDSRLVSDGTNNAIGLHDFGVGAPVSGEDMYP
eukprot:CAMPEP_0177773010 /NCGR_PEP_ID=MMETSP0491_2-20121128/12588_1 /TAXON_ID=63592 /ORGANISM="Tetraselmis chuii, Strain PLY429" /LENGTH=445 /DNA_ID=CAMNT_0019290979 /DNA_START=120 /DNA_END=1458 /DNA_ORIENTATION=-